MRDALQGCGPVLSVQDLRKTYGSREAVAGLAFSVMHGEIFGLLGPNGAGKTTTLSMLTGSVVPSAGAGLFRGSPLFPVTRAIRGAIGFVPEQVALLPSLTAGENVAFFGSLYGLRGTRLRRRTAELLEVVGLADRAAERVATFSNGMKRRVNIAAGLCHDPSLLFLDEPTVGVDAQSRAHIYDLVRRLNRESGLTIIYTSHYMEEVNCSATGPASWTREG